MESWEILCAHLSISSAEQAELKRNYQGDYRLQKVQALMIWKHTFGQKATYGNLVNIVKKLFGSDLAEDITDLALDTYRGLYCYDCA